MKIDFNGNTKDHIQGEYYLLKQVFRRSLKPRRQADTMKKEVLLIDTLKKEIDIAEKYSMELKEKEESGNYDLLFKINTFLDNHPNLIYFLYKLKRYFKQ